mmetsp:Transcript_45756/g.143133  ORF Transcript_45756/g.143133 Transcript_45756/m.143133 type:complete len:275 (-) Transcript_45756:26-850(-)
MSRPLNTLASLSPASVRLLEQHGFRTVQDIAAVPSAEDLGARTGMAAEDARRVFAAAGRAAGQSQAQAQSSLLGQTAASLHVLEKKRKPIITFVRNLDRLLGGGVAASAVTEFCGVPGIGKTQFAMQIAVNTTIPLSYGGVEGEAIVIDTEGSFMPERVEQMASALCEHLRRVGKRRNPADPGAAFPSADEMLQRIHIMRCHDALEQCAAIKALPRILQQRQGKVRAVIIDSMAFHFRHNSMSVSVAVKRALGRDGDGSSDGSGGAAQASTTSS